uniref:Putative DNA polymerase n=1 Tax=viral metagenome TaxID=1070528 RepID=A0A6M3L6U6_9ZZZZ
MLDDWAHMPEVVPHDYVVKPTASVVKSTASMIALDTETDNQGGIGQWSIAYRNPEGQLEVQAAYGQTKLIYPPDQRVCFHNYKYDGRELARNKMPVPKPDKVFDTMIAAYTLGLGRQKPADTGKEGDNLVGGLGLKYLARRHLGMEMKTWQEVKDHPEQTEEYNANDSIATFLLAEKWIPQLPQHFWDIDMPLLDVLMKMEDRGIKVDPDFIKKYAEEIDVHLDEVKKELGDLNPYATEQVADYVYGTLGYPVTQKTSTGKPQVTKEILETIDDPIVRRILEYKGFYQEKKTYISNYVKGMDLDNRVHCEFKQTSTSTGRLSAARPNLQNVVKEKTDKSKSKIRDLFIAPEGMLLVRVDWQQLELRVFAALTQDEHMLKALLEGQDIHQMTADMLGVNRDDAKINNFLTLYGGTAWAISREFHIPIDKAKRFQKDYYEKFPGVEKYMAQQRELAETEKKVYSHYGRVCRLDGMFSDEWKVREDAVRLGINMPIQGTAGEIVKLAMIDLHYHHEAPMLLQIHDELIFEVPAGDAKDYALWLKEYLPTLTQINDIDFPVDVGVGRTWLESAREENKV